jgi:4-nitrophenyl phosphatase
MRKIESLILDMDGVLWHGETPQPGIDKFFSRLDDLSLPYVLATNNAMRVASQYTEKLARFGVTVAPERILTSSEATASYIERIHSAVETVYVVGESGLHRAMTMQGFRVIGPEQVRDGETAEAVVAGLTRGSLTYELLAMGTSLLNKGALFIATNIDATYPTETGPLPGAGAIVSVLEVASGRSPTVIGKPNPHMFEEALRRLGPAAAGAAMVGDRLTTDIAGGNAVGISTILVLSGVSTEEDIETSGIRPNHVVRDITALGEALAAR